MLTSFKSFLLSEVALSPSELLKPNGQTGEARLDILQRLIQNKEPIELNSGDVFVVTKIDAALKEITRCKRDGKAFVLVGKVNNKDPEVEISTSKIKKSAVFGGGNGGSSGGTVGTALAESAQCYYCSAVCNVLGAESAAEKYTADVLKKAAKYVSATNKVEDVISNLSEDWVNSSILIANKLYSEGYIKKGHTFHRGDSVMKQIYTQAQAAYKNNGMTPIAPDKWNPSDIWAISSSFNPNSLDTDNIKSYNKDILTALLERECVGISLKKAVNNVSISRYNIEPAKENNNYQGYSWSAAKSSPKLDHFFGSNSIGIFINDLFMEVRSFAHQSDYSFEIQGKNARGGRIKLKDFNAALQKNGVHPINESAIKSSANKFDTKPVKIYKPFIKEWYDLFNKINNIGHISYGDFESHVVQKLESGGEKAKNWLYSKFIGTQILTIIEKLPNKKRNAILGYVLALAASSTDTSSAFIKAS